MIYPEGGSQQSQYTLLELDLSVLTTIYIFIIGNNTILLHMTPLLLVNCLPAGDNAIDPLQVRGNRNNNVVTVPRTIFSRSSYVDVLSWSGTA